ncbi:hypothetical protein MTR67_023074 [Solanum verrucosum]|uniref:Uncharacterized protein n=1 Tax=Solanum verrucosum TaxID=315347 RepID=A0AAF0R166_SOLVR|nr:hypothetical protein MTR67_023074 [Solanum verrucosum]
MPISTKGQRASYASVIKSLLDHGCFYSGLDLICHTLYAPIYVATFVGVLVAVTHLYHDCFVLVMGLQTWKVFPIDLPTMPTDKDIDFCIDLEPDTHPISIPSYRMFSTKFREVKTQLHKLLDKGFVHPSGCP